MESAPERKLTTILAADVAGYSAMMDRDEAGTLARLKACVAILTERISDYRGRLVGTAGDSVLAEFASVVNAVECAVRTQREISERNALLAETERMRFRIGINLGDVMVEGGDLFGEGVNIAARLEALAEPGGFLISGAVFDQVRSKLALGFDPLGPQRVKNISEPISAWRVVLSEDANSPGRTPAATMDRDALGASASIGSKDEVPTTLGGFVSEADAARSERQNRRAERRRRLTGPAALKRRAVLAAIVIVVVFIINMLTWSGNLWFQWPTLGILTFVAIRTAWVMGR